MHKKTEVILIRHGETEWNLSGRWQGHADSPLSNRGIEQAEALGQRMKNENLDCFFPVIWSEPVIHPALLAVLQVGRWSSWNL